jgi:ribosome-binding protein aMBF1 (putative translation factor)
MFFRRRLRCSFCGRPDAEVDKLVAGAHAYICDRCAEAAVQIMNRTSKRDAPAAARQPAVGWRPSAWRRTWHFAAASD